MTATEYNPNETNGLTNGAEYHDSVDYSEQYTLGMVKDAGGHISRVRLLTEWRPGGRVADVSYIHATLADGRTVPVQVGGELYLIPMNQIKKNFIDWAKREGVYAKGIGLLDQGNWSVLY